MSVAKGNCLDEYSRDCNIDNTLAILINCHAIAVINRYMYCLSIALAGREKREFAPSFHLYQNK